MEKKRGLGRRKLGGKVEILKSKKRVNSVDNKKKQREDLTLLDESLLARLDILVDLFSEMFLE